MQIKDYLPFLHWWPKVTRRTLRADLVAGITGAVIVLPQGVAFAIIAGLPPEYGLYSAIVPAIICTVLYVLVSAVMVGLVPYQQLGVPAPMALAVM